MPFELSQVAPWGRSYDEYVAMFALSRDDLRGAILACADGPAAFNCGVTERGGSVISVDPLYGCTAAQIRARIEETFEAVMLQTRKNAAEFVWERMASVEELGRVRMEAMRAFLADYDRGKSEGRYKAESLPSLSFSDGRFDLALCSHFLFLYSDRLDAQFHLDSVREMCRVAREARIFPLLELGAKPSRHVRQVMEHLAADGFRPEIAPVPYEFQKGGNRMLRVRR